MKFKLTGRVDRTTLWNEIIDANGVGFEDGFVCFYYGNAYPVVAIPSCQVVRIEQVEEELKEI